MLRGCCPSGLCQPSTQATRQLAALPRASLHLHFHRTRTSCSWGPAFAPCGLSRHLQQQQQQPLLLMHQHHTLCIASRATGNTDGTLPRDHNNSPTHRRQDGSTSGLPKFISAALKALGAVALMIVAAAGCCSRPALAATRPGANVAADMLASSSSQGYRYTGIELAAQPSAPGVVSQKKGSAKVAPSAVLPHSQKDVDPTTLLDSVLPGPDGGKAGPPAGVKVKGSDRYKSIGVPLDYNDLMASKVYAPEDVPKRLSREEIAVQLHAIKNQYDNEDFDLGIKQFMIEQQIQDDMEDGINKKGDNKDFEEKLAEVLFQDDDDAGAKDAIRTDEIVEDAWATEVGEEFLTLFGEPGSLKTAWRVQDSLREVAYTQFWYLVSEGHVARARFYGPEGRTLLAQLRPSAPGGARVVKVVVPPDPDLLDHLAGHGVAMALGVPEAERVHRALIVQVIRYAAPFMFISAVFWLLHTWILDPTPNAFRRREFLRFRREMMHVASKLNFRSPARQVQVDVNSPDFIPWDEIHGIDEVKGEIHEIIEYLKDPALLRLRGVNRIGGVLLAGAPGTGKTLLAKAIAAESGVRMFTCSGTDFYDIYTGVGARRIRETFEKMRNFAPAILFIDEFDALGAARGTAGSGDESANIINELLVQMDGFEDNRGIVVLGATNRPGAIDSALVRPGRFDRIIYMPLPDTEGRAKILQVHARNKQVEPNINWYEVARSMAGFTGADCMGLMMRAARMAARQGRDRISEDDIYSAMENKAMEAHQELTSSPVPGQDGGVPSELPINLRKAIATYEAGKALVAYITPEYEEIARVSVCPAGVITGYTLFVEDEERDVNAIVTRADMEGHMVVHLGGRCAEKLVMGESEVTGLGSADLMHANLIAREMVLSMGMGRRMGPVDLMHVVQSDQDNGLLLRAAQGSGANFHYAASDMSTEQSRVAFAEVVELLEAAEAKALYGLSINWKPLGVLTQALLDRGTLMGKEVAHILESNGVIHFPDPFVEGFGWSSGGQLMYPFRPEAKDAEDKLQTSPEPTPSPAPVLTGLAAKTLYAGTDLDVPRNPDGSFRYGWHWNMPYSITKELPEWYKKEVERYSY